jgi:putative ABC transport system ATP-binding protein
MAMAARIDKVTVKVTGKAADLLVMSSSQPKVDSQSSDLVYQCTDLRFAYRLGSADFVALRGLSMNFVTGCFSCISGPSGSGKSTLLHLLGLIEEVQQGDISFFGMSFGLLNETERAYIRRFNIGFVFQNFHLIPVLSAYENVEYFLTKQGLPVSERRERTEACLNQVGLWEHRRKRPGEMSGGQRQRVAIARALAKHPKVIIADEPTASLDQKTGSEIMEIFGKLSQSSGVSMILTSHDPMVHRFCAEVVRVVDGRIDPEAHGESE